MELRNVRKGQLQHMEHYQFADRVLTLCKEAKTEKLTAVLGPLEAAVADEDKALNQPRTEPNTQKMREADEPSTRRICGRASPRWSSSWGLRPAACRSRARRRERARSGTTSLPWRARPHPTASPRPSGWGRTRTAPFLCTRKSRGWKRTAFVGPHRIGFKRQRHIAWIQKTTACRMGSKDSDKQP